MVVGISGGADSTALLVALSQIMLEGVFPVVDLVQDPVAKGSLTRPTANRNRQNGFLIAAHFNHALRGQESDADQQFVFDLAKQLGVQFVSARSTQPCQDEATMGAQRMKFLIDTAKEQGARYIALAHSLDDNVETVLHQLMRGTGPAGLCGIGNPRNIDEDLVLVRPMLGVSRDRIRTALQKAGQTWREDSSNANVHYSRNWIRHELIPLIQSRYPAAVPAINRAIEGQKTWRSTIDSLAEHWIDQHQLATSPATFRRNTEADVAIVIAAMQQHWTRSGWPRGSMTRDHWLRLAKVFLGSNMTDHLAENHLVGKTDSETSSSRFDLPAGVQVHVLEDRIILLDLID